jgi:hypothetical protein
MGHPGRDALASFIDAAIGIDEDITPAAVTTVFNHLYCTACALAKRNKSDKMHGSGVYNPTVGDTITVDYQGLITPPSARGNTGFFFARCASSTYVHTSPTKSKDSSSYIDFLKETLAYYRSHNHVIKHIRSDYGSVENSKEVTDFLRDSQGIHPSISTLPAAPAMQNQNPAEREIQTMIKQVGAIMTDQYTLGPSNWDYAVAYWTKTHNAKPNTLTDGFSPSPTASHPTSW